ncbi:mitochondrial fission ELM1 family protein [Lichenihabitans sp. PAMC28606]|uniref:mitochondrial fission ELM1 family protein n=1 Tax=Lichenihabitans sp. PAMC28606 TaxID=2880932 RepID=UPI001D09F705|nr:mitochondrial fission ELM1 family protein [Lichenihabitans sp. PAMC28606]UDL93032.1 mitochondrial fission ELM1 family protein [Lichenihabitans sp. PAMC28606]
MADADLARDLRSSLLPPATSCWIVTDGKAGDLIQCLGVAAALGLDPQQRIVRPRPPWSWMAPRGPLDPRDSVGRPGGPLAGDLPDIALASGRRAVPALRALKRASRGRTFTAFLKDPRIGVTAADVIWVPEHDPLRGANVIVTLTSPHRLTTAALAVARQSPDARLAGLPQPRVAMMIGGPSQHHRFDADDVARVLTAAKAVLDAGHGLMISPSRRTPSALIRALLALSSQPDVSGRCFVWTGEGSNPYLAMLALASSIVVTGDSVNMIGEAAMTGAPIHIIEVGGGHRKITAFVDRLIEVGAARRWGGKLEKFAYTPIDATPVIARAIATSFIDFRARGGEASTVP